MTRGEQTHRKIVEAAAPIFNQRGYDGSSINDLMEATGLKKGGIYRHFSSKEELAAEAFDYTWDAAWNARLLHVDEKANGIEKLKQLIANFVDQRRKRGETRGGVDPKAVATLIVATLEGAFMMSRLERNDEPLRRVQQHLNRYLDNEVAAAR